MKSEVNFSERPPKSVGIWIRVSTEDQAQGDSPKHHEIRARHYAAAKGWDVLEVYDLAGVSGKAVMDHKETRRMMEDVRKGRICALIFSKLARLTRNARELMDFSEFFRQHNADLVSLQENIDTGTPSGRLFYNMVAVMAQWEREEISDRVSSSIAIRAKLGKPINGKAPFGYHWKDKKLLPHPEEAPVRRLMYELFAQQKRMRTVATMLNERGHRTRDGSMFSGTSVERLLRDSTAKGIHRSNFSKRVAGNKPWALKPEHEWVLNPVEPIISEELWNQCNALLENRRTQKSRPGKRPVHLFAGLTICECGKRMYVPSNSPKYLCTACKNKIPIVDLEGVFRDELKDYLVSPAQVEAYVKRANQAKGEKATLVESMRKELQKVRSDAERTHRLYLEGALTVPQFKEIYQPLDERKRQIEEELPRLEAEADLLSIDGYSTEQIMADAQALYYKWPDLPPGERRQLVELLVKDIVIGKGEITLNLCYHPSFKDMANKPRTL